MTEMKRAPMNPGPKQANPGEPIGTTLPAGRKVSTNSKAGVPIVFPDPLVTVGELIEKMSDAEWAAFAIKETQRRNK